MRADPWLQLLSALIQKGKQTHPEHQHRHLLKYTQRRSWVSWEGVGLTWDVKFPVSKLALVVACNEMTFWDDFCACAEFMELTDFFPGTGGEGRRAEALGSYESLLCPILPPKEIYCCSSFRLHSQQPVVLQGREETVVCESGPRVWALGRELSEQPYLLTSPCHCRGSTAVWLVAWINSGGEVFLLEHVFWGSVMAWCCRLPAASAVCRGAEGAVAGGSLHALLSPSVVCGLVLVCANSCYSVGSCQSSAVHAAAEPVEVSLFNCLSSWNWSRLGSILKNSN